MALPLQVIDAFVVIRLAEIIDDKRLAAVIDRAVAEYGGNGGCLPLTAKAAVLNAALA